MTTTVVMPGHAPDPKDRAGGVDVHVFYDTAEVPKTWMAGTSPAMTREGYN